MNPTMRRVLTAVVLLAIFLPAILWAPAWLWQALIAVVVVLAAFEWALLSAFPLFSARLYAAVLGMLAWGLPGMLAERWPDFQIGLFMLAAAFWLIVAPLWMLGRWPGDRPVLRAAVGCALLLPTAAALVYLHEQGPGVLLGTLAIVWIADTAAYFAGRAFGRHKLAPAISPGKTWEGVAGALLALALYAAVLNGVAGLPLVSLFLVMAGLLYLSVLGDLFESWIKRLAGMKDSGTILPGHGGVLDRVDALTSTLPVAAGILLWLEFAK
ncbi:MAG: phosphatidate cytidylyltransferase [Hydrogenophilales bacterium 16-64-46]|nr:MAG: phosphatidate cytidylyltransferase [Hydrogenophilales bacterium 12-64-13]OYZ04300.1 MAG: phosphatidate cytidylyltransferase [Hydrogenophilales bacterium 16-64-46]OZA38492.1 MAG: phosphatidate cytidylyltransferase [Hydrogenophilales bacterium 17-64-34]HQT00142.1 phosphatidate cytidylyltransferase [Thiobacillus sp.]